MDEHEMERAKKANKYLYGTSDHEKVKKALEFINSFGHLDDIDWEAEDPLEFARGIKNILDPQRKTKAFGFD
jgi:hypothetical protein